MARTVLGRSCLDKATSSVIVWHLLAAMLACRAAQLQERTHWGLLVPACSAYFQKPHHVQMAKAPGVVWAWVKAKHRFAAHPQVVPTCLFASWRGLRGLVVDPHGAWPRKGPWCWCQHSDRKLSAVLMPLSAPVCPFQQGMGCTGGWIHSQQDSLSRWSGACHRHPFNLVGIFLIAYFKCLCNGIYRDFLQHSPLFPVGHVHAAEKSVLSILLLCVHSLCSMASCLLSESLCILPFGCDSTLCALLL